MSQQPRTPPWTDMSAAPSTPAEDATMNAQLRTPPCTDSAAAPSASGLVRYCDSPPPAADAVETTVESVESLQDLTMVVFKADAPGRVERSRSRDGEIEAEEVIYAERDEHRTQHGHAGPGGPILAMGAPGGLYWSVDWPTASVEPARGGVWAEPRLEVVWHDPEPEATAGKAPTICWREELLKASKHEIEILQKEWQKKEDAKNPRDRSPLSRSPMGKLADIKRGVVTLRMEQEDAEESAPAAKSMPQPKSQACSSADPWSNYAGWIAGRQYKRKGSATSYNKPHWDSIVGSDEDEHEEQQAAPPRVDEKSNKPEDNKYWSRWWPSSTEWPQSHDQWRHSQ